MMMKEWNEDDRAFEPHDDDDGWSMGMMAMSEDGQDVDGNDYDVKITISTMSALMMTLDDVDGKQPFAAGLVRAAWPLGSLVQSGL